MGQQTRIRPARARVRGVRMGPLRAGRAHKVRDPWPATPTPDFDTAELPRWIFGDGPPEVGPISASGAENGSTSDEPQLRPARRTLHLLMFVDGCVIALAAARLLMG